MDQHLLAAVPAQVFVLIPVPIPQAEALGAPVALLPAMALAPHPAAIAVRDVPGVHPVAQLVHPAVGTRVPAVLSNVLQPAVPTVPVLAPAVLRTATVAVPETVTATVTQPVEMDVTAVVQDVQVDVARAVLDACPHVAEHVWDHVLDGAGLVLAAAVSAPPNAVVVATMSVAEHALAVAAVVVPAATDVLGLVVGAAHLDVLHPVPAAVLEVVLGAAVAAGKTVPADVRNSVIPLVQVLATNSVQDAVHPVRQDVMERASVPAMDAQAVACPVQPGVIPPAPPPVVATVLADVGQAAPVVLADAALLVPQTVRQIVLEPVLRNVLALLQAELNV